MNRLGKLIVNEFIKLFAKAGTWAMIAMLLVIVIGGGLLLHHNNDNAGDWHQDVIAQNEEIHKTLTEGKLSEKDISRYNRELAINDYRLEHDIPSVDYSITNLWAFAKIASVGIPSMIDIVALFTIIVAAGIVSSEFSSGAIKLLLIRPISRTWILWSKYLTTLLFALGMLVFLFSLSLLTGGILFGFNGISDPQLIYSNGQVLEKSMLLHVLEAYGLSSIRLLLLVTFAFLISAAFRSSSMAIGISLFFLFAGTQIAFLLQKYVWSKFILFANTDLNQYLNNKPFRSEMTLAFSLGVLAVYYICFLFLSWYIFRTRDVSN